MLLVSDSDFRASEIELENGPLDGQLAIVDDRASEYLGQTTRLPTSAITEWQSISTSVFHVYRRDPLMPRVFIYVRTL